MKQYKVIALSVGGLGNKIFKSGDTVKDLHFPPGNAEKLVEQGFLKPISKDDEELEKLIAAEESEKSGAESEVKADKEEPKKSSKKK